MINISYDNFISYFSDFKTLNIFLKKHTINFVKALSSFFFFIKDFTLYFFKKYIYTVNHKRIALNYLYFCFLSGLAGLSLATMIRIELSVPGSHFFKGDSIRYLQVITAHGLIMVFFVTSPLIFGFLANFFIPYHIGSKDVAFPRLNSFGFWILTCGFVLLLRVAYFRRQMYNYYSNVLFDTEAFINFKTKKKFTDAVETKNKKKLYLIDDFFQNISKMSKIKSRVIHNNSYNVFFDKKRFKDKPNNFFSRKYGTYSLYNDVNSVNYNYWYFLNDSNYNEVSKKLFTVKCNDSGQTMNGWTFITPFSSKLKYIGFGAQDIAIIGVIFTGVTTTLSFVNLLITRRTLSLVGLKNKKSLIPFLSISLFLTMRMLALITPVLGAAMIMLELDRHWSTSFFDHTYGGDPILFMHLFWFFGHPEVYVVIIPAFGILNMVIPSYNFRRVASKNHLIWATYIMAYMGFLVWGHHMYLIGLDHKARSFYSTITIMISLPAVVKIVNWTLTLLNGCLNVDVALLFALSFVSFFLSGGLTGMWLSHVGLNIYVHDTFYVVAHFHIMFSAATFSAIFCSIYYYFYNIFNCRFSKPFAYAHWAYWTLGQWLTFLPLYYVGYNGLPRRYHDYPFVYIGWQSLSSIGHLITLFSILFFFLMILSSKLRNKKFTHHTLFIPRFSKRILYYFFKIIYIKKMKVNFVVNLKIINFLFFKKKNKK